MSIRSFAKEWLPPAMVRAIRLLRISGIQFEGDFATWEDALVKCNGYDTTSILNKVLEASLKVKRGEALYERDSVLFDKSEYNWPIVAGLMWGAAQNEGRLNVLDFGGALGSSYFQNRPFLNNLPEVRWSVVEQSHFADAGKRFMENEILRFYLSMDECLKQNAPNVILLSSVLQYLPDYAHILRKVNESTASLLIIDRTPFNDGPHNKICIQKVPHSIYEASYPMRIFSQELFDSSFKNWEVVATILNPDCSALSHFSLQINFRGFILRRINVK